MHEMQIRNGYGSELVTRAHEVVGEKECTGNYVISEFCQRLDVVCRPEGQMNVNVNVIARAPPRRGALTVIVF